MKNLIAFLTIAALLIISSCGDEDSGGGDELSCFEKYFRWKIEAMCDRGSSSPYCSSQSKMDEYVSMGVESAIEKDPGYCNSEVYASYEDCFCYHYEIQSGTSSSSCLRQCTEQ